MVQRVMELRLGCHKLSTVNSLKDMKNAFACTLPAERDRTLNQFIPEDVALDSWFPDMVIGHKYFFRQRIVNCTVELAGEDGLAHAMPKRGNIIGFAEGPLFFSKSFNRFVSSWWASCENISPSLRVVLPIGGQRN